MAFNIGLSGLNAASTDIEVIGNNIANVGTVGFKGSRTEFHDAYVSNILGSSNRTAGSGVTVEKVSQQFG